MPRTGYEAAFALARTATQRRDRYAMPRADLYRRDNLLLESVKTSFARGAAVAVSSAVRFLVLAACEPELPRRRVRTAHGRVAAYADAMLAAAQTLHTRSSRGVKALPPLARITIWRPAAGARASR